MLEEVDNYTGDDLHLSWGHYGGANNLVLESGFTNNYSFSDYISQRNYFVSTVWNGNHNEGRWALSETRPDDRAKKHNLIAQPYKTSNKTAILFGQCPGDKALARIQISYEKFLRDVYRVASSNFTRVIYRPHPQSLVKISQATMHLGSLERALELADVGITYSSTAAIDCLFAGVPCIVLGAYSIAREVSSQSFDHVIRPDRTNWINKLSYAQWTHEELESGEAWEVLQEGYNVP